MKKICLLLMVLLLGYALFASTTDVYKTTTEISAYKKLVITDSLYEDTQPVAVTFTIKNSSNNTVANGGSLFSSSSFNYNQSYNNAIQWTMTGNQYHAIHVSFKFTPLYSGTFDLAGNMIVSDAREVIPYTVTFSGYSSNKTTIKNYENSSKTLETTKITSKPNNSNKTYGTTTVSNTTYRIYYAESLSYSGEISTAKITTLPKTIELTYDLSTNSLVTDTNRNPVANPPEITACGNWTRTGSASIQLNLNSDKASWTETIGNSSTTYMLSSGEHTYTAYVVVTISTD